MKKSEIMGKILRTKMMNTLATQDTLLKTNITILGKLAESLENDGNVFLFIEELKCSSEETSDFSLDFIKELEPKQNTGAWAGLKSLPTTCTM